MKTPFHLNRQILYAFCVYIGQILIGFSSGWTAPVVPKLQDPGQTVLPYVISDDEAYWLGSMIFVGSMIGPFAIHFISNKYGRKPCLVIGGLFLGTSYLTLALARSLAVMYAGRVLKGLGFGMVFIVNLVYIGEIASTQIRGILLTITAIFNCIGTLVLFSVGPYVSYTVINYIAITLSLLYVAGIMCIPETPLFLVLKGKEDEAKQILKTLGRETDYEYVLFSKQEIENNATTKWIKIFTVKSNRRALFITLTLHVCQQLSGNITLVIFITTLFMRANMSIDANIATIIVGVTELLTGCVVPLFVERMGRRLLLLLSTMICCLSMAITGIYFYLESIDSPVAPYINLLPLVSLMIFSMGYAFGFSIIPGTFVGEMFTADCRAIGAAAALGASWAAGLAATALSSVLLARGAHALFAMFSVAALGTFVFTVSFVPETRGKSLKEVQELLT